MNIKMAVIGLVGLKRAPECIKTHHFEGENAKALDPPPQTTFLDTGLGVVKLELEREGKDNGRKGER